MLSPPPDTRRTLPFQRTPRSERTAPFTLTVQDLRLAGEAISVTASGIARPDATRDEDVSSIVPPSAGVKRVIVPAPESRSTFNFESDISADTKSSVAPLPTDTSASPNGAWTWTRAARFPGERPASNGNCNSNERG